MPSPSPRRLLAVVTACVCVAAVQAQPTQQVAVAIPVYEAAASNLERLDGADTGQREWTDAIRFVTNRPSGSILYVSVEGELNGRTLTVEPVAGSQVIHQHQPVCGLVQRRGRAGTRQRPESGARLDGSTDPAHAWLYPSGSAADRIPRRRVRAAAPLSARPCLFRLSFARFSDDCGGHAGLDSGRRRAAASCAW